VDTLRTPDDRFADLPGYPFEPHYVDVPDGEYELLFSMVDRQPQPRRQRLPAAANPS
jgi:haloalkane dehalogenase